VKSEKLVDRYDILETAFTCYFTVILICTSSFLTKFIFYLILYDIYTLSVITILCPDKKWTHNNLQFTKKVSDLAKFRLVNVKTHQQELAH